MIPETVIATVGVLVASSTWAGVWLTARLALARQGAAPGEPIRDVGIRYEPSIGHLEEERRLLERQRKDASVGAQNPILSFAEREEWRKQLQTADARLLHLARDPLACREKTGA